MFNNADRKVLLGLVTGALLSTSVASVWAVDEKDTRHLIDSAGKPVLTSQEKKCVETPNTINDPTKKFEECGDVSDRDHDTIPDDQDKCPDNTPEEISKGVYGDKAHPPGGPEDRIGCPIDTDSDGVPDYRDDCPHTPPEDRHCVNERGCTRDRDGDGINDCDDKCPDVAGPREKSGCQAGTKAGPISLSSDTSFDFGKFTLRPEGKMKLDEIVNNIRRHSASHNFDQVFVEGYTDPVGTDASNMKLSVNRARSVADYLITNGIPSNKIVQTGHGESQCTSPEKVKGESKTARNERLQSCRRVDISLSLFQPDAK